MHITEISFSDRRELIKYLGNIPITRGVEIGVRDGGFSEFILSNTSIEKLYSVDPWEPNSELNNSEKAYWDAHSRLTKFGMRSGMIKGYSPQVCDLFKDEIFDFVYIDGLHTYEAVRDDIRGWYPKVKKGGVIAGHDYHVGDWPGVVNAVNEFVAEYKFPLGLTGINTTDYVIDELKPSWFFVKE